MSISATFDYYCPEGDNPELLQQARAEAPEVVTEYLSWLMQLGPDEVRDADASAPFLEEYYRETARTRDEWQEKYGIDLATDDLPEDIDVDVLEAEWQESTSPVPAEQVIEWARRWREIWSSEAFPEPVEFVLTEWAEDAERIREALSLVERQAQCARRYGLHLRFSLY